MESIEDRTAALSEEFRKQLAIYGTPNNEPPQKICGLNVDCWHEIFEWLSLRDIHSMGETCTRMQLIAGDYSRIHFKTFKLLLDEGWAKVDDKSKCVVHGSEPDLYFRNFVRNLEINGRCLEDESSSEIMNDLKSVKNISLNIRPLKRKYIEKIIPILSEIKSIEISSIALDCDLYEDILKYCPNLKRLYVNFRALMGLKNDWLFRKYPALEEFGFYYSLKNNKVSKYKINELTIFFKQNPQLKVFRANQRAFFANVQIIQESKMEFDEIIIDGSNRSPGINVDILNQLYSQGIYKGLCLEYKYLGGNIAQIASIHGLKKLKKFFFYGLDRAMIESLVNIEWIIDSSLGIKDVELLILHSPSIKGIRTYCDYYDLADSLLDWDMQRRILPGAGKVTLYIQQWDYECYMAAKKYNLKMIEIKRWESFE